MFMLAMAVAIGFSACKKEDDDAPKPTPTVTFKGGAGFTSTNVTKNATEKIKFGIIASGVEDLTQVRVAVRRQGSTQDLILEQETLPKNTRNLDREWEYELVAPGVETILVTVTMENGESTTVSFIVTINTAPRAVQTRENVQLGGQANATLGSFFNFADQTAMLIAQARANQANVDFIYYEGATNRNTICSADDNQVTQIFAEISGWTTRKANRFRRTTLTAADFDAIPDNNSTVIDDEAKKPGAGTMVNQLKVGDVFYFQIVGGDYGLGKITNIAATSTGSITFTIKFPKK